MTIPSRPNRRVMEVAYSQEAAINDPHVIKTIERGIIEINGNRVIYNLNQEENL